MKIQKITTFKTSTWSGGTTTELFIFPLESEYQERNFLFRLSSATVEVEKSVFSDLAGYQRFISPLEGVLKISHDEKNYKNLNLNELYPFDGGIKTVSQGKCRDFNLMVKDNQTSFIENRLLNTDNSLSIKVEPNEVFWLFSYENQSAITMKVEGELVENTALSPMTLFVFSLEENENPNQEITISFDSSISIFYGKVKV